MSVFLVLSSLSVAFYLVLLVALSAESRNRQRHQVEIFQQLEFGGSGRTDVGVTVPAEGGRPEFPDEALWVPVTRVEWKPAKRKVSAQTVNAETSLLADRMKSR